MKTLWLFLKSFLFFGVAQNTTSFADSWMKLPGGMTADTQALFGLIGLMNNLNIFSFPAVAVPTSSTQTPTLTAAQFLSCVVDFTSSAAGPITLTTPTAAQIIAACPQTMPKDSFNFLMFFLNDASGQTVTMTAGANVTVSAKTATIATDTCRIFLVNINVNAGTVTMLNLGGGLTL